MALPSHLGSAFAIVALMLSGPADTHRAVVRGSATAYAACDGSTSATKSGERARPGFVANNSLPIRTVIRMLRPRTVDVGAHRRLRYFRVMDRGGPGFALDFWMTCGAMNRWGRRNVAFEVVSRP